MTKTDSHVESIHCMPELGKCPCQKGRVQWASDKGTKRIRGSVRTVISLQYNRFVETTHPSNWQARDGGGYRGKGDRVTALPGGCTRIYDPLTCRLVNAAIFAVVRLCSASLYIY